MTHLKPIATSKEQSDILIENGVNIKSADMSYHPVYGLSGIPYAMYLRPYHHYPDVYPAWSLTGLLSLLPKTININGKNYEGQLCLCKFGYEFRYISKDGDFPFGTISKEPISACVNAVKWLHQENHPINNNIINP